MRYLILIFLKYYKKINLEKLENKKKSQIFRVKKKLDRSVCREKKLES